MKFANGREAEVEEVTPSPAIRRAAEAALTEALRELPGPPLPVRPTIKFCIAIPAGVLLGFHTSGESAIWVVAWPADDVRRTVRHELAHLLIDRRNYVPADRDREEAACDAFGRGDVLPLQTLIAERVARNVILAVNAGALIAQRLTTKGAVASAGSAAPQAAGRRASSASRRTT